MSSLSTLASLIDTYGPVRAARVSSAQARGAASAYPYWGIADYEIRRRKSDGAVSAIAVSRASSDRRSRDRCCRDLDAYRSETGRVAISDIGPLSEMEAGRVLAQLGDFS